MILSAFIYKFLCRHTFLLLWDICLNAELLRHIWYHYVYLFEELPNCFTAAALFYILTSNIRGFQLLHILVNTHYLPFLTVVILVYVKRHLTVALIWMAAVPLLEKTKTKNNSFPGTCYVTTELTNQSSKGGSKAVQFRMMLNKIIIPWITGLYILAYGHRQEYTWLCILWEESFSLASP